MINKASSITIVVVLAAIRARLAPIQIVLIRASNVEGFAMLE